jgi:hypothetical protein
MSDVTPETSFTCNIADQIKLRLEGRRGNVRHGKTLCSGCYLVPPREGQRYCRECHNRANREHSKRKAAELKRLRSLNGEG